MIKKKLRLEQASSQNIVIIQKKLFIPQNNNNNNVYIHTLFSTTQDTQKKERMKIN